MIHIVTTENRHLYQRQIWAMFEGRRQSFVERCGWNDLMVFEGAEVDDCDDERAVYLLALNEDEELLGAVRTRPTDDLCIMADKYPHLIAEGQPPMKGPQVWESTRVFTTALYRQTRKKGEQLLPYLAVAASEVAFDHGAERIIGMGDAEQWANMSGADDMHLTGLPAPYAYGVMVGTYVTLSAEHFQRQYESLAREVRIGYAVEDNDIACFGSLAAVQEVVDEAAKLAPFHNADAAREGRLTEEARGLFDERARAIASIEALYARHDAAAAPQSGERILRMFKTMTAAGDAA